MHGAVAGQAGATCVTDGNATVQGPNIYRINVK